MVYDACNRSADFTFDFYVHTCFGRCIGEELHASRRYILHDAGVPHLLRPGGIEYDPNVFRNAMYHAPTGVLQPDFFNAFKRARAFTAGRIRVRISTVAMTRTTEGARILHGGLSLPALVARGH